MNSIILIHCSILKIMASKISALIACLGVCVLLIGAAGAEVITITSGAQLAQNSLYNAGPNLLPLDLDSDGVVDVTFSNRWFDPGLGSQRRELRMENLRPQVDLASSDSSSGRISPRLTPPGEVHPCGLCSYGIGGYTSANKVSCLLLEGNDTGPIGANFEHAWLYDHGAFRFGLGGGYVAVSWLIGRENSQVMRHGWIQLSVTSDQSGILLTVVRWAYESTYDKGVIVGESTATTWDKCVINDRPVAFFKFNELAETTALADSSGNGYVASASVGISMGALGYTTLGTSALFSGVHHGISISDINGPGPNQLNGDSFFVECWIKCNNTGPAVAPILSSEALGSPDGWVLALENGVLTFRTGNSPAPLQGGFRLDDGDWHHVAIIRQMLTTESRCSLVIDGHSGYAFGTAFPIGSLTAQTTITVGFNPKTNDRFFGQIDEVACYNYAPVKTILLYASSYYVDYPTQIESHFESAFVEDTTPVVYTGGRIFGGSTGGRSPVRQFFQFGATQALGLTMLGAVTEGQGQFYGEEPPFAMPGEIYYYRAGATNSAGTGFGQILSYRPPQSFSYWAGLKLGNSNASPEGDTDRDGLSELLEYGLSLNPSIADALPLGNALLKDYPGSGNRLSITLLRDPSRSDITITVFTSSSLDSDWQPVAISAGGGQFAGPGYVEGDNNSAELKLVEIRDVANSSTKRFMKISVTKP